MTAGVDIIGYTGHGFHIRAATIAAQVGLTDSFRLLTDGSLQLSWIISASTSQPSLVCPPDLLIVYQKDNLQGYNYIFPLELCNLVTACYCDDYCNEMKLGFL